MVRPSEKALPDFAPEILRVQREHPSPRPRAMLYLLLALFACALVGSVIGHLDIIALAQGKLVPGGYVKIVQPPESGIVAEILVREGEAVKSGQVLMRMDAQVSEADVETVQTDLALRTLQLRRIRAELADRPYVMQAGDRKELYAQVAAQYRANREAFRNQIDGERAMLAKTAQELRAAQEMESRLRQTLPIYQEQEAAHEKLARDGFISRLAVLERTRERIEKEQELKAQTHQVASLRATIDQSRERLAQIASSYRQQLQNEQLEANAQRLRLEQEAGKQTYRRALLELRAPNDGIVKDVATHTPGTVVSPGTILMTVVPHNDPLKAEVWITNVDAGFVREGQAVRLKLAAYPFQKYGMVDGVMEYVSPDASELPDTRERDRMDQQAHVMPPSGFRALVRIDRPWVERDGARFALSPGMLVSAEVHLGSRTVMEYLLSPVKKTVHEAGRET